MSNMPKQKSRDKLNQEVLWFQVIQLLAWPRRLIQYRSIRIKRWKGFNRRRISNKEWVKMIVPSLIKSRNLRKNNLWKENWVEKNASLQICKLNWKNLKFWIRLIENYRTYISLVIWTCTHLNNSKIRLTTKTSRSYSSIASFLQLSKSPKWTISNN